MPLWTEFTLAWKTTTYSSLQMDNFLQATFLCLPLFRVCQHGQDRWLNQWHTLCHGFSQLWLLYLTNSAWEPLIFVFGKLLQAEMAASYACFVRHSTWNKYETKICFGCCTITEAKFPNFLAYENERLLLIRHRSDEFNQRVVVHSQIIWFDCFVKLQWLVD